MCQIPGFAPLLLKNKINDFGRSFLPTGQSSRNHECPLLPCKGIGCTIPSLCEYSFSKSLSLLLIQRCCQLEGYGECETRGLPPNSSLGIIWLLCLDPLWNQIVRWLFIPGTSLFPIPSSIYQPRKELIPQSIHQQVFVKYPCLCHCSTPCNIKNKTKQNKKQKTLPQPSYRLPFWLDRTQEKLQNSIEILNWSKTVLEYLLIPSKLRGRRIWND